MPHDPEKTNTISISGIVSHRDKEPYVQLSTTQYGVIAQLTVAEARSLATDIQTQVYRVEADAAVLSFFMTELEQPDKVAAAAMHTFREFRLRQDLGDVETTFSDPDKPDDGQNRINREVLKTLHQKRKPGKHEN